MSEYELMSLWYPLYEKMCELEVPAIIHVSGACNTPYWQTTGSYYLAADTVAFMQMMQSDMFKDFPELKLIAAMRPITGMF